MLEKSLNMNKIMDMIGKLQNGSNFASKQEDKNFKTREDLQYVIQSIFLDLGSSNDWVDLGTEKGGVWSLKLYRTANYNTFIV